MLGSLLFGRVHSHRGLLFFRASLELVQMPHWDGALRLVSGAFAVLVLRAIAEKTSIEVASLN